MENHQQQQKGNRVNSKFEELSKRKETALICYVVAGYPDMNTSEEIIGSLVSGGADIIELGIPFSDPIADGPTIQEASFQSLGKGITPAKCLALAAKIRKKFPDLPLLAMTYSNILYRDGIENFLKKSKDNGIDGFILPDLPVEEKDLLEAVSRLGQVLVFLVSPNTSNERLQMIVNSSSGFLYMVSVYGITGARKSFEEYTLDAVKKVKKTAYPKIPVAVGFGISTPAHVKTMTEVGADGVIVGSAIIDRIKNSPNKKKMLKDLKSFAHSMKKACKRNY